MIIYIFVSSVKITNIGTLIGDKNKNSDTKYLISDKLGGENILMNFWIQMFFFTDWSYVLTSAIHVFLRTLHGTAQKSIPRVFSWYPHGILI